MPEKSITEKEVGELKEVNQPIIKGLKDLQALEEQKVRYIVGGSVIPAALNGEFYRRVGDIDVMVTSDDLEKIRKTFSQLGYAGEFIEPYGRLGYKWLELHKGQTEVAFTFGDFDQKGGWRLPLKYGFSCYVPSVALGPIRYELEGISFPGLAPEAAYLSLTQFSKIYAAPKRENDLKSFEGKLDDKVIQEIKKSGAGLWFRNYPLPTEEIINFVMGVRNKILGTLG